MADWEVALIGVAGTALGAIIAIFDHRISATRDEKDRRDERLANAKQRREERLSDAKQIVYQPLMLWIGKTDKTLDNVYYSVHNMDRAISVVKQAEYREVTPPEEWMIPAGLDENTKLQLQTLGSPEVTNVIKDAEFAATRLVDEARSLGLSTIRSGGILSDQGVAHRVIAGWYKSWLIRANRVVNLIRADLDPSLAPVPLSKDRIPEWDEVDEEPR
jgi:hypothetical protein